MTDNPLVFIDLETTGLDARIHQPWEVCFWAEDHDRPLTYTLPHTLEHADARALEVGDYWRRKDLAPKADADYLAHHLRGATLVGANPTFDAAFLTEFIGAPVWHYRLIDVCAGAMWIFGWDRPRSLIDTATHLREVERYPIHEADHTAEGDVRAVRGVYKALRDLELVVNP